MPYNKLVPNDTNAVRGASGDITLMRTNFAVMASVVSGMTAPAEGEPMSRLLVTSGSNTIGFGWSGTTPALLVSGAARFTVSPTALTFAGTLAGDTGPTGDTHYMRQGDMASPKNFVEVLGGHIVAVASGATFVLEERAMYGYTIQALYGQTASGSIAVTVKIGAAAVTGLNGVTISGTPQTSAAATAANTVTSGGRVTMELGAESGSPSDLAFTLKLVRT